MLRFAQPPIRENRKFLRPAVFPAIQRQPAGRHPVNLTLPQQPEITRPLKRPQLVPLPARIQLVQHPKSRIPGVRRDFLRQLQRPVIKKIRHKSHRLHMCQREFIQVDRLLIKIAQVEKLHPERQPLLSPQRPVMPELDLPVLVVSHPAQKRGQIRARRPERLARPQLRLFRHIIQRHMRRLQPRQRQGRSLHRKNRKNRN